MDDDIHVMPVDDLREHTCTKNCPCNPRVEIVGAGLLYVHNAWDHREAVEQVEAMLGIQGVNSDGRE